MSYTADRDIIIKEGYFKKRNFKSVIVKKYKVRFFVLTNKYLDWYDHPKGTRRGTISLNYCYARIHDGSGLIVGSWLSQKEWLLRDEGANPVTTINDWYNEINKAIDEYKGNVQNQENENIVKQDNITNALTQLYVNSTSPYPVQTSSNNNECMQVYHTPVVNTNVYPTPLQTAPATSLIYTQAARPYSYYSPGVYISPIPSGVSMQVQPVTTTTYAMAVPIPQPQTVYTITQPSTNGTVYQQSMYYNVNY